MVEKLSNLKLLFTTLTRGSPIQLPVLTQSPMVGFLKSFSSIVGVFGHLFMFHDESCYEEFSGIAMRRPGHLPLLEKGKVYFKSWRGNITIYSRDKQRLDLKQVKKPKTFCKPGPNLRPKRKGHFWPFSTTPCGLQKDYIRQKERRSIWSWIRLTNSKPLLRKILE